MLYSSEKVQQDARIAFLFSAMALLYMFRVTISPIIRSTSFVIPNGRIRLMQLPLGVLVLVSQFRLLGVDKFNICGSEHHAL